MRYKYILKVLPQAQYPTIEIDEERFLKIKSANNILSEALALEEKYDLIIRSFLELQKELINIPLTAMVRRNYQYQEFFDERVIINLRLMTLLTVAKHYLDTLSRQLKKCANTSDKEFESFKANVISIEYDKNIEYRFMEALRNYVQHNNTPVHTVSTSLKWIHEEDEKKLQFSAIIFSKKDFLDLDEDFKKKFKDKLKDVPENVDLLAYASVYIESISIIQSHARDLIQKNINESRKVIETAINEYKAIFNKKSFPLFAYKFEGNNIVDDVLIFLDWDDVRVSLTHRNIKLKNLSKSFVTGNSQKK